MEKFDIDDPCPKIHTMAKYQDLRSAVRVELKDMCTKDECLFLLVDYTSRKALQKNV